jgi:hypothetical protein
MKFLIIFIGVLSLSNVFSDELVRDPKLSSVEPCDQRIATEYDAISKKVLIGNKEGKQIQI